MMMMHGPLMKCGHTAQGVDVNGNPVCVICFGLTQDASEVAGVEPSLENRVAKCSLCGHTVPSNYGLPFFESRPNAAYDLFYCGCRGWD